MYLIRIGNQLINLEHLTSARLDGNVLSLQLGLTKNGGESYSLTFSGDIAREIWEEIIAEAELEFD